MRQNGNDLEFLTRAIRFAAVKHTFQKRKDGATPYINHPIEVMEILATVGRVTDTEILAAAVLHDTVEDTNTSPEELRTAFGERTLSLIMECTDDKTLPKARRKQIQEEHASHISNGAKQIKICDKVSNMRSMVETPPPDWSWERRAEYLNWCTRVFQGLQGVNPELDALFVQRLQTSRAALEAEQQGLSREVHHA